MNFPPVEGGKGDPSNSYGNPAQYLSNTSKASAEEKKVAKEFFANGVLQDAEVKQWIGIGSLPIRIGTEKLLAASGSADFLQLTYDIASKAKTFGQSWDQALSPTAAETLLDNISKLFQLSVSPEQFAGNLNAVIGK
jgi:raffinose/stachyose/melibiose transport system substrate-binding protein